MSFTKLSSAPDPEKEHLFNLNLRSLLCSGVHVEALAEGDRQEEIMQEIMDMEGIETIWNSEVVENKILELL